MKKCPKCGLVNPDKALECDCGYNFETQKVIPKKQRESLDGQDTKMIKQIVLGVIIGIIILWFLGVFKGEKEPTHQKSKKPQQQQVSTTKANITLKSIYEKVPETLTETTSDQTTSEETGEETEEVEDQGEKEESKESTKTPIWLWILIIILILLIIGVGGFWYYYFYRKIYKGKPFLKIKKKVEKPAKIK